MNVRYETFKNRPKILDRIIAAAKNFLAPHHASKPFTLIIFDLCLILIKRLIIVDLTAIQVQTVSQSCCIWKFAIWRR